MYQRNILNELRFSCPACGQHISRSQTYGGQIIHCPNCCAELRIPLASAAGNSEFSGLKAELIHNSHHNSAGAANITGAMDGKELHCRCPVCQSKLRILASTAAQSADIFPSAELVTKPSENGSAKPAVSAEPVAAGLSMTEREKKIAAERAVRSVSPYPQMKPRLDLVLGRKSSLADSTDEETKHWT